MEDCESIPLGCETAFVAFGRGGACGLDMTLWAVLKSWGPIGDGPVEAVGLLIVG